MNNDGSINYNKLGELIDFNIENGTQAIIICGTTGESSTMTDDEHKECIRFAVEKAAKRVPVIAGTGSNDTSYRITSYNVCYTKLLRSFKPFCNFFNVILHKNSPL